MEDWAEAKAQRAVLLERGHAQSHESQWKCPLMADSRHSRPLREIRTKHRQQDGSVLSDFPKVQVQIWGSVLQPGNRLKLKVCPIHLNIAARVDRKWDKESGCFVWEPSHILVTKVSKGQDQAYQKQGTQCSSPHRALQSNQIWLRKSDRPKPVGAEEGGGKPADHCHITDHWGEFFNFTQFL